MRVGLVFKHLRINFWDIDNFSDKRRIEISLKPRKKHLKKKKISIDGKFVYIS